MSITNTIKKEVSKLRKELIEYRRHMHSYPELSFKEKETSAYIKSILDAYGIKYTSGYCKHGIVAEVNGARSGKLIYLRGDMDALPLSLIHI